MNKLAASSWPLMQDHARQWIDFSAIIAVQLMVLVVTMLLARPARGTIRKLLLLALLAGAAVGAAFDLFVGQSNAIFSYRLPLDLRFGVLNGVLSYGVALLTAAVLPIEFPTAARACAGFVFVPVGLLVGATICYLALPGSFATAVGLGLTIIAAGEFLIRFRGRTGPVAQLLSGEPANFLRLWLGSMLIGAAYEGGNLLFPVWEWTLFVNSSRSLTLATIIIGGYFVLFHALATVAALVPTPHTASQSAE